MSQLISVDGQNPQGLACLADQTENTLLYFHHALFFLQRKEQLCL
jgi:hypothetical protein